MQVIEDTLISLDHPYHLIYIFLTESNPEGGWWFEANKQTGEGDWLKGMLEKYNKIADRAISSRIFGMCCGINLYNGGVVEEIAQTLHM
jgi:hypothetical protein